MVKTPVFLNEVIDRITPSPEELSQTVVFTNNVVANLKKHLKGLQARTVVAGSGKKRTQLKNTKEIDLFVLFNYKKYSGKDDQISDILWKRIKGKFKNLSRIHGSRDYFQVKVPPYVFEIVPILEIKSSRQAKNITDVTPLHARWVSKNAKGLLDDIRLTKAFVKALEIYGAESYIRGFSGYSCEILTTHYGSFIKLLQASTSWKDPQIIDPTGFYRRRNPFLLMNKSKLKSPLILVDPVQSERNVTAALNKEAFNKFRKAASDFIKKPSARFFEKKIVTEESLASSLGKKHGLLLLRITPKKNKKDVMGAAILDRYLRIRTGLAEHGFKVKKSSWFWDEKQATLWFLLDKKFPLPTEIKKGPKASDSANSVRFRRKHKKTFVKRGRLYASGRRKFDSPEKLIKFITSNPVFGKRLKKVEIKWCPSRPR